VKAIVNGRARELPNPFSIGQLLELLGSTGKGIAVAQNDRVVRKTEYATQHLSEGDRVEIIEAVAGG
jgi:sulfur carrier protein